MKSALLAFLSQEIKQKLIILETRMKVCSALKVMLIATFLKKEKNLKMQKLIQILNVSLIFALLLKDLWIIAPTVVIIKMIRMMI